MSDVRKWTPGPWTFDVGEEWPSSIDHPNGEVLFGCGCCGSPDLKRDDAHLIAAAPDLYDDNQAAIDSLEFALSEMQANDIITQDDAELMQERIASLKASAAKARGEQ